MKIPKETTFVIIIGLFLLSYLLEAVVDPLKINLATPYAYLSPLHFMKYPFTTAVIIIRAISLYSAVLFLLSFIPRAYFTKVGILLLISALSQLYSLQEVVSGTTMVPLEWALSLSVAGAALLLPAITNVMKGAVSAAKAKINQEDLSEDEETNQE